MAGAKSRILRHLPALRGSATCAWGAGAGETTLCEAGETTWAESV